MIRANFTATLHNVHRGQIVVADNNVHPVLGLDEDGWLCTTAARRSVPRSADEFQRLAFHFEFIEHREDRTHYYITCAEHWAYIGARLESSSNGWLGLYGTHVAGRVRDVLNAPHPYNLLRTRPYWKIETLQPWDGTVESAGLVPFYLRDMNGYRVAESLSDNVPVLDLGRQYYLNASERTGDVLEFFLSDIQLT